MHPVLLELTLFGKSMVLPSYGAMLGLSMLLGWGLFARLCSKEKIPQDIVDLTTLLVFVTAIAGARIFDVVINIEKYEGRLLSSFFSAQQQGLTFYGGLIPAVAAAVLFIRFRRGNIWQIADCAAPSVAMGLFITRTGCFLAGCCFGMRASDNFGVTFPPGSPAFALHLRQHLIATGASSSLPVHPTQLYSSLAGFILAITSLYFLLKKKQYHGQVFWGFIFFYALFRFVIEFFRADPGRGAFYGLSTSQWLSMAGAGLALFFLKKLKPTTTIPKN